MIDTFRATKVAAGVHWVGAIDWAVRDFHGYLTSRGTTYNAFLVKGEKVALVDTVKSQFTDEMLARIAPLIESGKVDYIISNHAEPDHSGSLAKTIQALKPEKVFVSKMGAKTLDSYYGIGDKLTVVADGQCLDLGGKTITFAETRMCHWPDSMVSYLHEDKILFSQDAFGMHLASGERFADEIDKTTLTEEAAKYFANILMPMSKFIVKALDKLTGLGLQIDIIAPDHGPIWRENPTQIVADYSRWANQKRTNKAVVLYDTMWGSTDLLARAVGEGLAAGGAHVKLMPLTGGASHRSDVATEMLDAGALVVGSPTINNQIYPTLGDCLTYIQGLKPVGLVGGVFGSFGWSGEAPKLLAAKLHEMNVKVIGDPIRAAYAPDSNALSQCHQLGRKIAEVLP